MPLTDITSLVHMRYPIGNRPLPEDSLASTRKGERRSDAAVTVGGIHGRRHPLPILVLMTVCALLLASCVEEGERIDQPDQYSHVYEARETFVLRAIARVFNEKGLGRATIREDALEVTSDHHVQGEWRTSSFARLRKIGRQETEVTLTIVTEKKTSSGWEMRRLLGRDQYKRVFDAIETQIYREMYRGD